MMIRTADDGDDKRRASVGDALSLPNRLWRSLTGELWASAASPSRRIDNERRCRLREQLEFAQRRHKDALATLATDQTKLHDVEVSLWSADRDLSLAQRDLLLAQETIADLTQRCDQAEIHQTTARIQGYESDLINLERVLDLRRRHLFESDRHLHQLTSDIAQLPPDLVDRSELSDLQRQADKVETDRTQLRSEIQALGRQMDDIRVSCHQLRRERDGRDHMRSSAISSLDTSLVAAEERRRAVVLAQQRLDGLMALQLAALVAAERSREQVDLVESVVLQLHQQERDMTRRDNDGPTSPSSSSTAQLTRRHSAPLLDRSTDQISRSMTLLGEGDDLDRAGTLTVTPSAIYFDPTDGAEGGTVMIPLPRVVLSLGVGGPPFVLALSVPDRGTTVRFGGDQDVIEIVARSIRRSLAALNHATRASTAARDADEVPRPAPSSGSIILIGSSSILSSHLLRTLIGHTPARHHLDPWRRLYTLATDGMSLSIMYRAVAKSKVNLLLIEDVSKAVFGAYLSEAMQIHPGYFGSGEVFVFQLMDQSMDIKFGQRHSGEFNVYTWSGINKCLVLCRPESVSVGGGTHFAIFLGQDLRTGSSGASDTFHSPGLSATPDFSVGNIEVWGIREVQTHRQ